ncbi:MAG: hypothetical protein AAB596_00950 [Patescibacteria group bacterium]
MNQQLLDYIKYQLQEGIKPVDIKNILVSKGWIDEDVSDAMNVAIRQMGLPSKEAGAPLSKNSDNFPPKSHKWIFIILILIIILVVSAGLIFFLIPEIFYSFLDSVYRSIVS